MINGLQIYQIMELFSIYAILGWIISVMYAALTGRHRSEYRVARGPFSPAFGIGALIIVAVSWYLGDTPVIGAAVGLAAGTVTELIAMASINSISGEKLISYKWYHSIVWAAFGAILVFHLNDLILQIMMSISSWIHLLFLLIFWTAFLSSYIDGLWYMSGRKNPNHQSAETE